MVIVAAHTEMAMIAMVCISFLLCSLYKHVAFPSVRRRPAQPVFLGFPELRVKTPIFFFFRCRLFLFLFF